MWFLKPFCCEVKDNYSRSEANEDGVDVRTVQHDMALITSRKPTYAESEAYTLSYPSNSSTKVSTDDDLGRGERPAGRAELLAKKGNIWAHAASAGTGTDP